MDFQSTPVPDLIGPWLESIHARHGRLLSRCAQQNDPRFVSVDVNGSASPTPGLDELPVTRMAGVMAVYDDNQRDLFNFLLATTRDRQAAEDILQESFLQLIREVRSGRAPTNGRAWLFRVAANLASSRGRRLTVAGRALARLRPADDSASPEAGYLDQEQSRELDLALGTLSLDARRAVLLAAHGFNGTEIAGMIKRSPLATRSLLWRARLELREALETAGGVR